MQKNQSKVPQKSQDRPGFKVRSESLLDKLETMMDRVTESEVTPETVKAATDCADKSIQLMKLNFEATKYFAENGHHSGLNE